MNNFSILILLLFFASCGNNYTNQSKTDLSDFQSFLNRFKKDSIFQKEHMSFPVMEYYSDEDFPLDLMERDIDEENYAFNVLINEDDSKSKKNDIYKELIQNKNDSVFYHQIGINNSININYKFIHKKGSYFLVEIIDLTD